MTGMGRKPQGMGLIEALEGSKHAKARMIQFVRTLFGACSVVEASAKLSICESRFYDQRGEWLQGSLGLLEPRCPGRPSKSEPTVSPEEVRALRQRIRELEARVAAAEVQAELARTLPHVIGRVRAGKKPIAGNKRRAGRVSPRANRKAAPCR